jgi:hypothetical protein
MQAQKIAPGTLDPAAWEWAPAPGVDITLGGRCLVMPPMNGGTISQHWDALQAALQSGDLDAAVSLTRQIAWECLRRNYPTIPAEWVDANVDLDNWEGISQAAIGQGAFRRWLATLAERGDAGNALAPQPPATAGTGAPSTPASPPPPAGPSSTSTG